MRLIRQKRETYDGEGKHPRISWIVYAQGHKPSVACEFHCQEYDEAFAEKYGASFRVREIGGRLLAPFGFEVHKGSPLYERFQDPSHEDCTILGGKCWHDGSSLAATEFFEWWDGSDEWAFLEVEKWLRRYTTEDTDA